MPNRPKPSAKNEQGDYDRFESFMKHLMAVPHSEIKAKLDAERAAKLKRKSKRVSASRASNGQKD